MLTWERGIQYWRTSDGWAGDETQGFWLVCRCSQPMGNKPLGWGCWEVALSGLGLLLVCTYCFPFDTEVPTLRSI